MAISFSNISESVRASQTFIELAGERRSFASLSIPPHLGLIGQYDAAKTGTVDYVGVKVTDSNEVGSLFGFGSQIHRQAKKIPASVYTSGGGVTAFPVPEALAGVKATATIVFTGTATSSGTWYFKIGGEIVTVGVASGDTPTVQGDALVAAITANRDITVAGVNTTGSVAVTCKWKGATGNQIYIKQNYGGKVQLDAAPSGTTVSGVDAFMTTGATDPSIHDVFFDVNELDVLGDTWYTQFTAPFTDATNLGYMETSANARALPAVKRMFGATPFYVNKTYSQAFAEPATINSEWICPVWDNRALAPAFELSAEVAGRIAQSQNLNPGRPYKTLSLSGGAIDSANLSYDKADALFRAGMGYCTVDSSGTLILGDVPTSYRTDGSGGATEEWFDAVKIFRRQAKVYSIEQIFKSDRYRRAIVVDNLSKTNLDYAISPNDVVADIAKLVKDLWIPFALSKNEADILATISAEINSGNNSRIDSTVTDDEAEALRINAIRYAYLY